MLFGFQFMWFSEELTHMAFLLHEHLMWEKLLLEVISDQLEVLHCLVSALHSCGVECAQT